MFPVEEMGGEPFSKASTRLIVSIACFSVLVLAIGAGYIAVTADPIPVTAVETVIK